MKSTILVNTNGYRIISPNADIVIDPLNAGFLTVPDGVVFSCPEAVNTSFLNDIKDIDYLPVYTSATTKKLVTLNFIKYGSLPEEEHIDKNRIEEFISCRQRTKNTLRKHGEFKADIIFYGHTDSPGTCSVLIRTATESILCIRTVPDTSKPLPAHDILVINANTRAPIAEFFKEHTKVIIQTKNFSDLYKVIDYFNNGNNNIKAGVDETLSAPACEYLKFDCTVFTKKVKPLSSFKKTPPVIITTQPERYSSGIIIPSSAFSGGMSLFDIYSTAATSEANRKIVVTNDIIGIRKRGDIVFCGKGAAAEL